MITAAQLDQNLGNPISKLCTNGYTDPNDNHSAHFVSHMLDYQFGTTCKTMSGGPNPGANIRVQELFAHCNGVGAWSARPSALVQCLVFVTDSGNVHLKLRKMDNVPKKHVGIFLNGTIWHYSNSKSQVVKVTPKEFSHHYPGPGIALFYGVLPA